jgi:hypothetical protein
LPKRVSTVFKCKSSKTQKMLLAYKKLDCTIKRSLELLIPGGARVLAARISSSGTWRPHPPLLIIEKSSQNSLLNPPLPSPPMLIILSKEVFSF